MSQILAVPSALAEAIRLPWGPILQATTARVWPDRTLDSVNKVMACCDDPIYISNKIHTFHSSHCDDEARGHRHNKRDGTYPDI